VSFTSSALAFLLEAIGFTKIYRFSQWVEMTISAVAVIVAICFCWRKVQPGYLKGFPLYFTIGLAADILSQLYPFGATFIFWVFTLFEGLFFSRFFILIFQIPSQKGLMKIMGGSFLLIVFILAPLIPPFPNLIAAKLLESAILFIPCMIYNLDMLSRRQIIGIERNPAFFVVIGIFSYFSIQIPVVLFSLFFSYTHQEPLALLVYSVNNFIQLFSCAFFIKAMVCLIYRS